MPFQIILRIMFLFVTKQASDSLAPVFDISHHFFIEGFPNGSAQNAVISVPGTLLVQHYTAINDNITNNVLGVLMGGFYDLIHCHQMDTK